MSGTDYSRKHALECLRLAADCMQLVGDLRNPTLQSHFARMARVWSDLAVRGPSADMQAERGFIDGGPRARDEIFAGRDV